MRIVAILLSPAVVISAQDRRITPIAVNRKQALVIGNSAYPTAPLENAGNDAVAMEATLRRLGLEVRACSGATRAVGLLELFAKVM
jgi:hypothetical protein